MDNSKYKLLLKQDECAPDSLKHFTIEFYNLMGKWISDFTYKISPEDLGDTLVYKFEHKIEGLEKSEYKLSNEIGFWKLEIKIK